MTIVSPVPFTLQNGQIADATQVMANLDSIIDDVNANAAASGANNDITALLALTTPISYLLGGTNVYIGGTVTGTANAIVLAAPTPASWTLTAGKRVIFFATAANTGATTLNVFSTGVKNVFKLTPAGAVALTGGEIQIGICEAVYDGTQYQLITNALTTFGPQADLASATATDLGTIPSHNVNITGTTTITGFGSSASISYPIYRIKFAGILTLTHNGTSLIIPGAANITTAAGDSAVVEYLGSGNWKVLSYTRASGLPVVNPTGILKGIQAFTTGSGNYTPTVGATRGIVVLTGGGGGGGGAGTANGAVAGGGGAGATAFLYVSSLALVAYVVGAGGIAGVNTGGTGGTGGQSAFGTTTANGGLGGVGTTALAVALGGAGSSTTANATFTIPGQNGLFWGPSTLLGGGGASSFWGGGAQPLPYEGTAAAGNNGIAPGSGAGGGYRTGGTNEAGGVGAAGIVVVFEFQ